SWMRPWSDNRLDGQGEILPRRRRGRPRAASRPAGIPGLIREQRTATVSAVVSSERTRRRLNREHGEAYPSGTETEAAPATVSAERHPSRPLPRADPGWEGRVRRRDARARRPAAAPETVTFVG